MFSLARSPLASVRGHSPWLLICVALTAGPAAALQAASPRDELLRFVPEKTGFCVIFQGLRTHWASLQASPFVEQLRRSPLAALAVLNPEDLQKVGKLEKNILKPLGLDWDKVRDDLLGEAVIFAFRPGPPGQQQQDQGLLLLRVQNAKTLADLIERFNERQKEMGQLKELVPCVHNGVTYFRRVEVKETSYYFLRGPILLLTSQEDLLQKALDCDRTAPADAEPFLAVRLRQLGIDSALLTFWFNPREFDAHVKARADQPNLANAVAHQTVARYWQALDDLAVALALDKEFSVQLAIRARLAELPEPMRRFLTDAGQACDLWRFFPSNALLVVAGRYNGAALLEALTDFLPPKSRATLLEDLNSNLGAPWGKKNFIEDVLPFLGPDFGLCLTAPGAQDKGWFPQLLFALRVKEGKDPKTPVDKALLSAVTFLAQLAQITHNQQNKKNPISLEKSEEGKREIHYLTGENVFPPGVQPSFALHGGYLLLASMPETIRRFGTAPPVGVEKSNGPVPLVRISVVGWRNYLQERRDNILQAMTAKNELTRAEAELRLERLLAGLQFLDRVEIRQQANRDQVVLTFALVPAQALRK